MVSFTAVLKPKSGGSPRLLIAFALFRLQGIECILKQQFHPFRSGHGQETNSSTSAFWNIGAIVRSVFHLVAFIGGILGWIWRFFSDKFLKNAVKQKAFGREGDSYFAFLLQDWEGMKEILKQNVVIAFSKLCKASVLCRRSRGG